MGGKTEGESEVVSRRNEKGSYVFLWLPLGKQTSVTPLSPSSVRKPPAPATFAPLLALHLPALFLWGLNARQLAALLVHQLQNHAKYLFAVSHFVSPCPIANRQLLVRPLDEWVATRNSQSVQSLPLSALKGAVIGIDASHYIHQHLVNQSTREALLGALGGFPFALRTNIEKELQAFKSLGVGLVFVFNGLDFGRKDQRSNSTTPASPRSFEQAWDLYDQQQADQVVDAFSNAGMVYFFPPGSPSISPISPVSGTSFVPAIPFWIGQSPTSLESPAFSIFPTGPEAADQPQTSGTPPPETLYRFLQRILLQNGIPFMVAPYSAAAQLAYLGRGTNPVVDAIYGPSELFLFDVEKLVIRIETDPAQFTWLTKQTLQEELGRLSNEQFVEFLLLLGSPFLRSCPLFETPGFPGKTPNVRDALPMYNSAGRNALTLCAQYEEDRRMQEFQYTDLYKRAYMNVKHHVYMDVDGRVALMEPETASSDMHEIIGQRLPEELYFYLSKGILGPDIPNFLTSGEVRISLPLGAEDTEVYRQLVGDTLTPIRIQSISLLTNSLHRFYQVKEITVRPWFDENSDRKTNLKSIPSVKETIQGWKVKNESLPESIQKLQAPRGTLKFAVQSLNDPDFVATSSAKQENPVLSSQDEILSNVLWRFLQLRGYVDAKHNLTVWGKALSHALADVTPSDNLEEAIFIAIEMLRFDLLNTQNWFSSVSGGPMRGSDEDKTFNMLVSRVACIGKLQHKNIGYSGPLSRQLLCYRSLISEVRSALRNLVEVVLASLLLSGEADRDRNDWSELGLKLPFIDDNDCGLGIAVRTYLDDLPLQANPTSPEARAEVKSKGKEWFQHSESFTGNLDLAFKLWDSVYKGTQHAGKEIKDAKLWDDANKWLSERR
ncbi:XPG N-terminal [Penicillium chermesinum]|uniref:XPG N-terminal n=1 Tax=Penicillium chermesinum TaxID=63820 RepID=A0A9W9PG86_9EURO|nr:XPG N-terminal [Penicillium chermesinum]KAJ5246185.1 XPG N-terminal [Penicillium chermesinum]